MNQPLTSQPPAYITRRDILVNSVRLSVPVPVSVTRTLSHFVTPLLILFFFFSPLTLRSFPFPSLSRPVFLLPFLDSFPACLIVSSLTPLASSQLPRIPSSTTLRLKSP